MTSAIPHHPAATSPSSASPLQFSSASEANSFRLKAIVERLTFICRVGARFDPFEFSSLCFALARGVDYALTITDVPAIAHRLPSLIKQTYERRNNSALQPAIMMLSVSTKNACKYGWFHTADADEILRIANELFDSFCMTRSVLMGLANPLDVILKIIPRFYPQLKFCSMIVSFEAKPGYEVLMTDFQIPRNQPPQEKIRLFVVQTDNLETSSCIITPPQVSFLINGKGVERRTNVSPDIGPQLPTDITKMLKYGTNIIQSIGYFSGTYLIALAYISKLTAFSAPPLKDHVEPVITAADADSEIVEGASRITLNCPFSFKRIKTPVKGHLCKHHQCFDYDNFMEMNSRNPSWRCPSCHQHVSCIDLCIDRNMAKANIRRGGKRCFQCCHLC
ncbi:E4 SUMO-protein ligase PIAL2-like isoform X2 [Iris pallida]|uniref:E4 SUMO-protein ligase PIAL2-like isoform X2 n=1 Tax=Iris pallida TaxID=29817 RepID=A0AAX6DR80_IRIPA|nr:E4 SUMO-protein ligase PIAL2-like isoform X2 [Iris pallida]